MSQEMPFEPSDAELLEYATLRCDAAMRLRIEEALRGVGDELSGRGQTIAERLKRIQPLADGFNALREHGKDYQVEAGAMEKLYAIAKTPRNALDGVAKQVIGVVEVIAQLVRDSWDQKSPVVGYRGGRGERLLSFSADAGTLDLRLSSDERALGKHWIVGQCEGIDAREVEVLVGDVEKGRVGVEDGYFEISVESGVYTVRVVTSDRCVVIQNVSVGEA